MKPELYDVVELLENIPARNLQAGMQGAILEDYGTAYEVEFADDQGAMIEMLALKPARRGLASCNNILVVHFGSSRRDRRTIARRST